MENIKRNTVKKSASLLMIFDNHKEAKPTLANKRMIPTKKFIL